MTAAKASASLSFTGPFMAIPSPSRAEYDPKDVITFSTQEPDMTNPTSIDTTDGTDAPDDNESRPWHGSDNPLEAMYLWTKDEIAKMNKRADAAEKKPEPAPAVTAKPTEPHGASMPLPYPDPVITHAPPLSPKPAPNPVYLSGHVGGSSEVAATSTHEPTADFVPAPDLFVPADHTENHAPAQE